MQVQVKRCTAKTDKLFEDMRKVQVNMYKCSGLCRVLHFQGSESWQNCVYKCVFPVKQVCEYVKEENKRAMEKMKTCLKDCDDKTLGKLGLITTKNTLRKQERNCERCSSLCLEKHCEILSSLQKSIDDVLILQSK